MASKSIIFGILLIILGLATFVATKGPDDVNATANTLRDGGKLSDAISKDAKAIGDHLEAGIDRAGETLRTGEIQPAPKKYKFTALIPAGIGLLLVVCGALAMNESRKKHAMHAAAMLGLIGCAGALFMVSKETLRLINDGGSLQRPIAFWSQVAMALLSGVFLFLCVRSFVQARKARLNV